MGKSGIVKYGYTPQCKVCLAMRLEQAPQGHSDRNSEQLEQRPEPRMRVVRAEDIRVSNIAR